MEFRSSVPVIFVGISLLSGGAIAQTGGGAAADECRPNQCTVVVTVANNCSTAANITVNIPTMKVPRVHKQIQMDWELATGGFRFAREPNGITFTTAPLPPANEFHHPNAHTNDTKYKLTNANSPDTPTEFKYNIRLLRADGSMCPLKDPVIRNGS